jgi:hypothetical protein
MLAERHVQHHCFSDCEEKRKKKKQLSEKVKKLRIVE